VEIKEHDQVKVSNRLSALENFDDDLCVRAWESIRGSIKSSATESLGYYDFKH